MWGCGKKFPKKFPTPYLLTFDKKVENSYSAVGIKQEILMSINDFVAKAKASKIGSDSVNIDGARHAYDILPPTFEPNVPYFVGYPHGYLFISEQVPESFRKAWLAHEIKCTAIREAGVTPYCVHAFEQELKFVPKDIPVYLSMRKKMFDALISYYKDSGSPEFMAEITRTRDRIVKMMTMY